MRPSFAWTAVAASTFYDLWIDDTTTNTQQVIRQQQVPSTSFTALVDLANGHSYRTWVRAGNAFGYGPWSVYRDTTNDSTPPVISNLAVSPSPITSVRRPSFSGAFSADVSGIDAARTTLILDLMDVTAQAVVTFSGFSFSVPSDLSERTHALQVTVYSGAGLSATRSISVTTDYTPPGAPVIASIVATADRITVSGPADGDATVVLADADAASVESSMLSSTYVVVFAKTNSDTFNGQIAFQDAVGNTGPTTQQNFTFASETPAPVTVSAISISVPTDKTSILDGNKTLTNSQTVTVRFTVQGGTAPYTARVNGSPAAPVGSVGTIFEATLSNLKEGVLLVTAVAEDAAGQTGMHNWIVVVDTTPPVVTLQSPSSLTTANIGFLFLNGLSETDAASVRNDPSFPRVVYGRDSFGIVGKIEDALTDVGNTVNLAIRETDAIYNDLQFPFHDYAVEKASTLNSILKTAPVRPATVVAPTGGNDLAHPHLVNFTAPGVTANLQDSDRSNTTGAYKIYLVTVRVSDVLGNENRTHIWVKCRHNDS